MGGAEGDLLRFCEEIGGVAVQCQAPDDCNRSQLFRYQLGGIEEVDALEHLIVRVRERLDAQIPLREDAALNGVPQIPPVEIRVDSTQLLALLPNQ